MLAAEQMKEALERIDSAAMFVVAGERTRGLAQADQNIARFEQQLAIQQSNITERGEPEATSRAPPRLDRLPRRPTIASSPGPITRRWRRAISRR